MCLGKGDGSAGAELSSSVGEPVQPLKQWERPAGSLHHSG